MAQSPPLQEALLEESHHHLWDIGDRHLQEDMVGPELKGQIVQCHPFQAAEPAPQHRVENRLRRGDKDR